MLLSKFKRAVFSRKPLVSVLLLWLLALVLLLSSFLRPVGASSLLENRVDQLAFQVRSLQTQINQLQNQSPRSRRPSNSPEAIRPSPTLDDPSLDEQFDNLATLVIEINQRLMALENQLARTPR